MPQILSQQPLFPSIAVDTVTGLIDMNPGLGLPPGKLFTVSSVIVGPSGPTFVVLSAPGTAPTVSLTTIYTLRTISPPLSGTSDVITWELGVYEWSGNTQADQLQLILGNTSNGSSVQDISISYAG